MHRKMRALIAALGLGVLATACTPQEIALFEKVNQVSFTSTEKAELAKYHEPFEPAGTPDVAGQCETFHDNALRAGWPEAQWPHLKRIMWRESNCRPMHKVGGGYVRTFCCYGLMQVYASLHYDGPASDLYNADVNLRVAARMWRASGWGPWAL